MTEAAMNASNTEAAAPSAQAEPSAGLLLLVLAALALLDHLLGADFSLRLFYLMPVALAALVFGRKGGFAVAAICTGFCVFVDGSTHSGGAAELSALAWSGASSAVLFTLFASVVAHYCGFGEEELRPVR